MNPKKIIVPTDFSHGSDAALEYATVFAKDSGGTLVIVHIEEPAAMYGGGELYYGPQSPNRAALQRMLNDLKPTDPSVAYEHRLLASGPPANTIVNFAKEANADLIVMSSHGRTGFKRFLLGSVAEVVVRHAPCPVLIVKQHAAKVATVSASSTS